MRYTFVRKINLANIDREIWGYESEDIGVVDADSFDEAIKEVDKRVAERIGYYKGKAEAIRAEKNAPAIPTVPVAPTPPPVASAPPSAPVQAPPESTGVGGSFNQPPKEFDVE